MSKAVIFIVGPTGSGKSKLALILARKLKAEIVSADSMQIYKGMNIGTAKPTKKEQKLIRHHLLDQLNSRSECSVIKFQRLAFKAIGEITHRKHLPIVVGGSGFYVRALIDGLDPLPGKKAEYRKRLEKIDSATLHKDLKKLDPASAARIHPNDQKRIIRALEIINSSPKKELTKKKKPGLRASGFKPLIFGLNRDRKELYERIEKRVDEMLDQGWIQEVKRLKKTGFSQTARYAIGYKEILEFLINKRSEDEVAPEIKKRTRHLAKRQMTWFRKEPHIKWYSVSGEKYEATSRAVLKEIKGELNHAA